MHINVVQDIAIQELMKQYLNYLNLPQISVHL